MHVKNASIVPFSDGTVNFHIDLAESHFSGGTYLDHRHVAAELSICNESADNLSKGKKACELIREYFKPTTRNIRRIPWKAR